MLNRCGQVVVGPNGRESCRALENGVSEMRGTVKPAALKACIASESRPRKECSKSKLRPAEIRNTFPIHILNKKESRYFGGLFEHAIIEYRLTLEDCLRKDGATKKPSFLETSNACKAGPMKIRDGDKLALVEAFRLNAVPRKDAPFGNSQPSNTA